MGGKYSTKETEDLLNLAAAVAVAIIHEGKKDGWQPSDLIAFLKSPEVEAAIASAIEGIEKVPAELVELDVFDGLHLGRAAYAVGDKIVDALKAVLPAKSAPA